MSKKLISKITVIILLALIVCTVAFYTFEGVLERAFMARMCGNTVTAESKSPDGKLKAVAFGRSCGATDSIVTHFSILPADEELPNERGNLGAMRGLPKIEFRWTGDKELVVTYPGGQLYNTPDVFNGITIRYAIAGEAAPNNSFNRSSNRPIIIREN